MPGSSELWTGNEGAMEPDNLNKVAEIDKIKKNRRENWINCQTKKIKGKKNTFRLKWLRFVKE